MKNKNFVRFFAALSFGFVLSFCAPAWAVFNLAVTPDDGGFDLRFGRLAPGDFKSAQQVTVRVTSDSGTQYRVMQRYSQPLMTADGTSLVSGQLRMSPRVGSSTMGSLLYSEEGPIENFDTILYTSNGTGTSDSFQLIYTLSPSPMQSPGSYYGRVTYILVPVDSTQEQVVVTLNAYADLAAGTTPAIEVATDSGQNRLSLDAQKVQGQEGAMDDWPRVNFRISAPVGAAYRIYQNIENGSLTSPQGEDFDLGQIRFAARGASRGAAVVEGDLKGANTKQLLYTSDPEGALDSFVVVYGPGPSFKLQPEGVYRGRIVYTLESAGKNGSAPQEIGALDVEVNIPPVFDIRVYSDGQEGVNLNFGDVSYKTGPKTSDVEIYVDSNLRRPYQIVQKVANVMMNERGDKVPPENFTMKVIHCGEGEAPRFILKDATPVKQGDTVVFSSGSEGESTCLKVQYQLIMGTDSPSGGYGARLGYSLALN